MTLGGYADKVAWVDLTTGKTEFKPIPEEDKLKYIGARGVGVKFVFDNGPQVDPLSPDNILCFMNGPMTGSEANMSGRMAIAPSVVKAADSKSTFLGSGVMRLRGTTLYSAWTA